MEAAAALPSTTARAPTRPSSARSSSSQTAAWSPPPPPRSPPHGRGSISPYDFDGALPGVVSPPPKAPRRVPPSPFKVLDDPALQDDFYLNLVDWSSHNVLAVGPGNCLYLCNACSSKVTKLCDLGAGDSVCSVVWAQRGTHLAVGTNNGKVEIFDAILYFSCFCGYLDLSFPICLFMLSVHCRYALKASETAQSLLNAEREHSRTIMFSDEEFNSLQLQVPEGLEMCVCLMLPGVVSIITCPPDYAYDKFARPENVSEGAYVQREFELLGFEMPKENRLFKDGKFELAKAKYEKCLS
ncbi:Protein FIZZY-RELATED 2 [Acorus calamus]|uniref:Protein FIZZY-RELATED 2 n=1 Tax=Acorus calamus TaxID=4465 RepID=A0AAV9FMP5_ACOCL|nr:Protein FIZZY-RELATED 2 [Acorus calamus]